MKNTVNPRPQDIYESPAVMEYVICSEGLLCASGVHDPLTEDDDWADLLD